MIGTKRYPFPTTCADALKVSAGQTKSLFGKQSVKGWDGLRQVECFLRTTSIDKLIELGTGEGMHTLYFGLAGAVCGFAVSSYDASDESRPYWPLFEKLGIAFHQSDVFEVASPVWMELADAMNRGLRVCLYCDIGLYEAETFVPCLPSGSWCIIHSWKHMNDPKAMEDLARLKILEFVDLRAWESTGVNVLVRRR